MFQGPDIGTYYRNALDELRDEVARTSDVNVLGYDEQDWIHCLIRKYGMEPIMIDSSREEELAKIDAREPKVRYRLPVISSGTLQAIFYYRLGSTSVDMGHSLDEISYDHRRGYLSIIAPAKHDSLRSNKSFLQNQVENWNKDIRSNNQGLPEAVRKIVQLRITEVHEKDNALTQLAKSSGIRLVREADLKDVVPIELPVKKSVAPLISRDPGRRLKIDESTLRGILELLDCQARQFERTPTVFSRLAEEDLRDIMLSSLNAVFRGSAVGEAFQGLGKADIHLRVSEGEVFLAEVKFWNGPSSVHEVTAQLLERLTWREGSGVVIVLSRNVDFGAVVTSLRDEISTVVGARGSVRKINDGHFACRFVLPSDKSSDVDIRFLVYNLHTNRPSGRSALSE